MRKVFRWIQLAGRAFAVCTVAVCLFFCSLGFSYTGKAKVKHNGLCEVTFSVKSGLAPAEFKQAVQAKVEGYNTVSGKLPAALKLEGIRSKAEGYEVEISTRRIDKIETSGTYEWRDFATYVEEGTQMREWLDKFEMGNISAITATTLTSKIKFYRNRTNYPITPKYADGTPLSVAEMSEGKKASKDAKILVFKLVDLQHLEQVKVTLPGKISYYAGESFAVEGDKTLVLTPKNVEKAEVYDIASKQTEIRDVQSILGYVVYDPPMSPAIILLLCLGGVLIIGGTVLVLLKFYRDGKKILMEREGDDGKE